MRKLMMLSIIAGAAALGAGASAPAQASPRMVLPVILSSVAVQPGAQVQQVQYRGDWRRREEIRRYEEMRRRREWRRRHYRNYR